jgi:hypothetical protein
LILLSCPQVFARDINIREDKDGRMFFTGAFEEAVKDFGAVSGL